MVKWRYQKLSLLW